MLEKIALILYLSGDSISVKKIAEITELETQAIVTQIPQIRALFEPLGLTLMINGDDISVVSRPEFSSLVESFRKEELKGDLTPATLQVLTLVAYLGSPTREEISYIRGVQSSQSIRILNVRGLISRSGEVCTLTDNALKQLGVVTVSELPEYERIHSELSKKLKERDV
jgi:segregation and condensation protein B